MRDAWSPRPSELRLAAYTALGAAAGLTYVVFDVLSEAKIRSGTLTGPLARAHDVIDHVLPVLVGVLLGVGAHYLRLRAQLLAAEEAAGRAEALRVRLLKVERDQAVWVLAAAILHEVNNPLHALGLLLDELPACAERDEARRGDLIARARAQADRALSQLRLLRSVGGAGEPDLQRIALDRVVGSVADDIGALAREDGLSVTLECERPVKASADPVYVRTILENLLGNSLQSLQGRSGHITIRLGVEDGRAVVRVRDDGPPVDPSVRATLFEPLRTTKALGLGLGLPIARALARAMRGDLALDEADAGAKSFRLELPLGDGP
jgi:two-component system C4-dicarboxylate transport sensor histidine kinase DctB